MKNKNNCYIAKVQPRGAAKHLLDFFQFQSGVTCKSVVLKQRVFAKIKSIRQKNYRVFFLGWGRRRGQKTAVSVYIWGFDCYDNYMLLLAGLTDVNCLDVFELFSLFQPVSEDSLKTFKLRNLMKNKSDKMFVRINTVFLPLSVSISLVSAVESNEV